MRSHDFIGVQGANQTWKTTEVLGTGWPSSAGGKLVGSLAGLPYALAEAEQNFLIPSREQASIWGDLVPQMILSATIPRWWNVTPAATALGGDCTWRTPRRCWRKAPLNAARRKEVIEVLGQYAAAARGSKRGRAAEGGRGAGGARQRDAVGDVLLADELGCRGSADAPLAAEIRREAAEMPRSS